MSDNDQIPPEDKTRNNAVVAAGWTAGLSAFFIVGALASQPTWPMAIGAVAVAAMVAAVCYFILKR